MVLILKQFNGAVKTDKTVQGNFRLPAVQAVFDDCIFHSAFKHLFFFVVVFLFFNILFVFFYKIATLILKE